VDRVFAINVPAGATKLVVTTVGATTDLDLYMWRNTFASANMVCAAETASGNETCTIDNPVAGAYLIDVFAFRAFSGVTLTATLTP